MKELYNIKNRLKKFKGKVDSYKRTKRVLGVLLFGVCIVLIYMAIVKIPKEVKYDSIKNEILSNIDSLVEKNQTVEELKGEKHFVEGFNVMKDTLPFRNFASEDSKGGNCEGYCIFEKLNFSGKLSEYLEKPITLKNLHDYHISKEDLLEVYPKSKSKTEYVLIDKDKAEIQKQDYNKVVKQAFGIESEDKHKDKEESTYKKVNNIENENVKNILNYITLLQVDSNNKISYPILANNAYYYYEMSDYKFDEGRNSLNPKAIIDKIDKNELVVLAFHNHRLGGHALLAYGYENIDDTNIKVYISDSNFPKINDNVQEREAICNKDTYILFTKDVLKNAWSFIYNPNYYGILPYDKYNSFIPGTRLYIYDI